MGIADRQQPSGSISPSMRGDLRSDAPVAPATDAETSKGSSVRPDAADAASLGRKRRGHRGLVTAGLLSSPFLVTFVIMAILASIALFALGCSVRSASSGSGSSTATSSPVSSSVPRVSIDYAGLDEMFAGGDGASADGYSEMEEIFRDKYMYFPGNTPEKRCAECWPIPYANTHRNSLCYNGALTNCLALALRDYTITLDSTYDEIVADYGPERAYKSGHEYAGGRTIWPKTFMEYYAEKRGLKWNIIKEGTDGKTALQQVKEALMKKHPVVFGDGGYLMKFYADNEGNRTYDCGNGHTIMFYKYEDGIFWAKDTVRGTHIPYPETGGTIEMESFFARTSKGYIGIIEYYTDKPQTPKFPNIPKSMLYDDEKDSSKSSKRYKTSRGTSQARTAQSGNATVVQSAGAATDSFALSAEGTTVATVSVESAGESDGDGDISGTCGFIGTCSASDSSIWVTKVLHALGEDINDGLTPSAMYEAFCEMDSGLDPSLSSMEPGMIVASPHVASSNPSERAFGHCGIYVGNGLVMHDIGTIETIPVREFLGRYGNLVAVGWGWPGRLADDDGTDDEGSDKRPVLFDGKSSLPLSYGVPDDELEDSVTRVACEEAPGSGIIRARLIGSCESEDRRSCILSYVVSDGTGRERGISACLSQGGVCHAFASRFLVVDCNTMYDMEDGEYVPVPEGVETEDFSQIRGDFDDMTPEEYLRPFLDPETAIS